MGNVCPHRAHLSEWAKADRDIIIRAIVMQTVIVVATIVTAADGDWAKLGQSNWMGRCQIVTEPHRAITIENNC